MITIKSVSLSLAVPVLLTFFLVGCGGGGGGGGGLAGGIGGTGVTSGAITGFGSVFVNGVEFETGGTRFDVDGDDGASEGDLGIGMVVTVIGTVNDNGVSGTADSIEYDDEVEGPIAATPVEDPDGVTRTFNVFDVTIVVDRNATVFVDTTFDDLAKDDIVEVSGFFDQFGNLAATRLEKEGVLGAASVVEARGTVSGCGGDCAGSFTLGSLAVTYDGFTDLSDVPGGIVADGQSVGIKGVLTPPSAVAATRIELEGDGFDGDVEQVSIEGIVTNFISVGNFRVSGQRVDASGAGVDFQPASLAGSLGNGDEVEVEGSIAGGILQAVEVEQRGGDVKISAFIDSVAPGAGTVTMRIVAGQPLVTVTVDTQTQLEDKTEVVENLSISDLEAGDFLNIEGYLDGGTVIANQIERDAADAIELQGPADVPPSAGNDASGLVSILDVTIATGQSGDVTAFENVASEEISGAAFFASLVDGDLIAFEDENNDGLAEEVEFED